MTKREGHMICEEERLGFSGEMAAQTRECALEACHGVLQLDLDIHAQLILMYLVGLFLSRPCTT